MNDDRVGPATLPSAPVTIPDPPPDHREVPLHVAIVQGPNGQPGPAMALQANPDGSVIVQVAFYAPPGTVTVRKLLGRNGQPQMDAEAALRPFDFSGKVWIKDRGVL